MGAEQSGDLLDGVRAMNLGKPMVRIARAHGYGADFSISARMLSTLQAVMRAPSARVGCG